MDALTAAFHERMNSDATLTGLLATFQGGPAIFTDDRVPGAAELPYVVSSGQVSDEPWDTKTGRGRWVNRDVYCYGPHQSTALIEQIAERVRRLFHRHRLAVAGHRTVVAVARGPVRLSSDDYDARLVTVSLRLTEVNP